MGSTFGQWVYDWAEKALSILPDSPFKFLSGMSNSPISRFLGYLNWFIPVATCVSVLEAWCAAILIYYLIQIILRWSKVVE